MKKPPIHARIGGFALQIITPLHYMYSLRINSYPNREIRFTLAKIRDRHPGCDRSEFGEVSAAVPPSPAALDISSKLETGRNPVPRAASRFGLAAKRTLMRIGGALNQYDIVPSHCLFFTGTLPGGTPAAMAAIARDASWVVHRLKAWIARSVPAKFDFYVWELQKRGALHLHYCLYCPDALIRDRLRLGFHEEWCRLMDGLSERNGCDCYQKGFGDGRSTARYKVQAYCQEVRQSVAAYMSKYCSKTAGQNDSKWQKYWPKRWWGCSRPLLHLMHSYSTEEVIEITTLKRAETLLSNWRDDLASLAVQAYQYRHKVGLGITAVSYHLDGSWKLARDYLSMKVSRKESSQMDQQLRSSFYFKVLQETTILALSYRSASPRFKLPLIESRVKSLRSLASDPSMLTCTDMRRWAKELRELSLSCTLNHAQKFMTATSWERLRSMTRSLWRIQDSGLNHGAPTVENCYEISRILFSECRNDIRSTTDSDNGAVTPQTDQRPCSAGADPSLPRQLELELSGSNIVGGGGGGRDRRSTDTRARCH